ncbi:MAG: site-specific integrase [Pyrinomonadaceae bacterium]|nr:site-specific integrase [Pyrinomonadaceae bacterium]
MADVFRQVHGLDGKKDMRFDDFVADRYLPYAEANKRSFHDDVLTCRVLIEFFGKRTLRSIKADLVEEFKQRRLATPLRVQGKKPEPNKPRRPRSPATVNRELSILPKIFSLAFDAELVDENPCRRVKNLRITNLCGHCLTTEEEQSLFAALAGSEWVSHIVLFASHTGMRRGEIFNLRWFDIDLTRETVHVRQSKNGKARAVPMNETIKSLLQGLPKTSEYVFPSPKTGGRVMDVGRQFERAVKEAGLENFRFHDLRHTAATRMADAGVDPFTLAYIFGWSDIRMAMRYTHATNATMRQAVRSLDSLSARLGNALATKMKTAGAVPP